MQVFRLLQAHEIIVEDAHEAARAAASNGDDGTNDVLVSDVIRRNELQVWFVSEHIAGAGIADPDEETARSAAAVQA
jgi:starvation-inducible DNA-binding protein